MSDSIITLFGVVLGASIPILKDYISGLRAERIERIKIHDSERVRAYRDALDFVSELRYVVNGKTESIDLSLFNGCSGKIHKILSNLVYFSPKVREGFLEIEEILEHIMDNIMDTENNTKLVEDRVPSILKNLKESILNDFKMWN